MLSDSRPLGDLHLLSSGLSNLQLEKQSTARQEYLNVGYKHFSGFANMSIGSRDNWTR